MDAGSHEEHGCTGPAGCDNASRAAHDPESSRVGILLAVVLCLPLWILIFWLIL